MGDVLEERLVLLASLLASGALSAFTCSMPPQWFRLLPEKTWRIAGAIVGAILGSCMAPISFITFGWIGASLGAAIGEYWRLWAFGHFAMEIFIPASVAFGAALVSLLLASCIFGVIAALQVSARARG